MQSSDPLPPSIVRRAAAIARGPHACPACEAPTWAEPPVPWVDVRDYVVRCDSCERPVTVKVDRDLVLQRRSAPRDVADQPGMYDPVAELLDRRGRRAFWGRVAATLVPPVVLASCVLGAGGDPRLAWLLGAAAILPSSMWAPGAIARAWGGLLTQRARMRSTWRSRQHHQEHVVELEPARWDQWAREEKRRQRERAEQPEAVLRELERVLDDRELRRVRALAEQGAVPPEHLDDLLRFRRTWNSVA